MRTGPYVCPPSWGTSRNRRNVGFHYGFRPMGLDESLTRDLSEPRDVSHDYPRVKFRSKTTTK